MCVHMASGSLAWSHASHSKLWCRLAIEPSFCLVNLGEHSTSWHSASEPRSLLLSELANSGPAGVACIGVPVTCLTWKPQKGWNQAMLHKCDLNVWPKWLLWIWLLAYHIPYPRPPSAVILGRVPVVCPGRLISWASLIIKQGREQHHGLQDYEQRVVVLSKISVLECLSQKPCGKSQGEPTQLKPAQPLVSTFIDLDRATLGQHIGSVQQSAQIRSFHDMLPRSRGQKLVYWNC